MDGVCAFISMCQPPAVFTSFQMSPGNEHISVVSLCTSMLRHLITLFFGEVFYPCLLSSSRCQNIFSFSSTLIFSNFFPQLFFGGMFYRTSIYSCKRRNTQLCQHKIKDELWLEKGWFFFSLFLSLLDFNGRTLWIVCLVTLFVQVDGEKFRTRLLLCYCPAACIKLNISHLISVIYKMTKTTAGEMSRKWSWWKGNGIVCHPSLFHSPVCLILLSGVRRSCPVLPPGLAAACLSDSVIVSFRARLSVIKLHYLCCIVFHHQFPHWNNWDRFPWLSQ